MTLVLAYVVQAGAVVAALTAIVGMFAGVARYTILNPIGRKIDDKIDAFRDEVDARLRPIEYQLNPNGGGSMRDGIKRIEAKIGDVHDALESFEARTTSFIRAQSTALERKGLDVPRPEDFDIK